LRVRLVVAVLVTATGGCSWLIGVSEDPVVGEVGIDAAVGDEPDAEVEAAAEDATVE
jgi:hypothetical protein